MQIILAAPRGFCAGVNMAIESLETALKLDPDNTRAKRLLEEIEG